MLTQRNKEKKKSISLDTSNSNTIAEFNLKILTLVNQKQSVNIYELFI